MKIPAAIRDARSPVFIVVAANSHHIPVDTFIDAGPHMLGYDWIQTDHEVYGYSTGLGLPPDCVEPVNAAARRLLRSTASRGPRKA